MAANITFFATDDADWTKAIELLDNGTGAPISIEDIAFDLTVAECGCTVLSASTADATIEKPAAGVISWRFTKDQLGALCVGNTYGVGITMTTDDGQITQLVSGSLVFKDGSRP